MKIKENKKTVGNTSVCVPNIRLVSPNRHLHNLEKVSNSPKRFDSPKDFRERSLKSTSTLVEVGDGSLKYEMDEWLTSDQAASYLKVSKKTLLNMVSSGRIPYTKLGRSNRYLLSDLHMLLFSEKRGPQNGY